MKNERNSGLIRHVDELGRLVLPKEMRRQLNIAPEDAVEISICGRGIHVRKYQPMQSLDSLCKTYLDAFFRSCRTVCVVCSTEQVVATRGMDFSTDLLLSEEVRWYIAKGMEYQYEETHQLNLFDNSKYVVDSLYPVSADNNPVGAVLLIHFRHATPVERGCARFLADILSSLTSRKEVLYG